VRSRIIAMITSGLLIFGAGTTSAGVLPAANIVASDNATLVKTLPEGVGAISMAFSSDTPHMYLSTLKAIQIYDISDPKNPVLTGVEPLPNYQNEAMSLGERKNGDKFVLVGSTLAGASPRGPFYDTNSRYAFVVDVTDPAAPKTVAGLVTESRTHTISCTSPSCEYAYTDGRTQGKISIIDLRDWRAPKMAGTYESVVPQGHDQDVDDAGVLWHVGGQGAVALDVRKPTNPVPVASTNLLGLGTPDRQNNPYNNFILHNSARPNAKRFKADAAPSLANGNVLLATEEDTGAGGCGPRFGSFSTWHIPYVDAGRYKKDNPGMQPGNGSIKPLDIWYPEDAGVYGANCSAHYFDYNSKGFVAQGWYELGVRILDVRDPRAIKQVGFFMAPGANETWAAYWVPQRNPAGKVTGRSTNIVYTADAVRGVDILEIELPGGSPKSTRSVSVPTIPGWNGANRVPVSAPSKDYGFACRLPLG
jgi:hypothetical protein